MRYIVVMTLAGSIIILMFLLMEWIGKGRLYARQRYLLLKIALAFYLIPSVSIAMAYREMWYYLQKKIPVMADKELPRVEVEKYIIYHTEEGIDFNKNLNILLLSTIVWFVIACLITFVGVIKSTKQINKMIKCSSLTDNERIKLLLKKYKKNYGIHRKIYVYEYPVRLSPFTIGFLRPKIFVYAKENERTLELALKHEMVHIRRGDVLIKQLATLAKYIHWFNPLAYFLRKRIENVCELACDETVVENANEQMRKDYAGLILETANSPKEIKAAYGLSGDKIIEERILCIMKNEQKKKWNKVVVGVLMGVLVFANSLTALANPVVTEVEEAVFEEELAFDYEFVFTPEGENDLFIAEMDEMLYDVQFVDENGNIYPVDSGEPVETMTLCSHTYVSGKVQRHIINPNGGCVVEEYSAKRCSICGTIVMGDFIASYTYAVCPH